MKCLWIFDIEFFCSYHDLHVKMMESIVKFAKYNFKHILGVKFPPIPTISTVSIYI